MTVVDTRGYPHVLFMTSSGSLRDSYSSSPSSWSFRPSPPNSDPSPPSGSAPISKYEWSTRLNTNSVFDLAPSLPYEQDGISIDVEGILKGLLGSALLQYAGTALVMPWEVGKVLLQIQWIPRYGQDVITQEGGTLDEDAGSEESSDEAYFQDPSSSAPLYPSTKPRLADEEGYIVRRSVLEEETRPEYVMPLSNTHGVWGMIKKIIRWRNEGWFALWKGLLTTFLTNTLSLAVQPLLQELIASTVSSPQSHPSPIIQLASHFLTGILLSPLDLVRTRLIAQSSIPRHRTYTGPFNALGQLIRHEGGIRGLYLHPHLFIPAVLDNLARPFANLALPAIAATRLGIGEDSHPFVWMVTQISVGCLANLVTTPIETVRRRLQVQTRGTGTFKACVETRPAPYHGVVDATWRIMTEERSEVISIRQTKDKDKEDRSTDGWVTWEGIGQLYHGLGMNIGALIMVSILSTFGGVEQESGWTEL